MEWNNSAARSQLRAQLEVSLCLIISKVELEQWTSFGIYGKIQN
jgi:hypothetical protein